MESLGLDVRLLLAQIVNFAILLFILNKLLYKPLSKILNDRNKKVEDSIRKSEEIETRLKKVDEEEKRILEAARQKAEKEKQELIALAEKEKDTILSQTKEANEREIQKAMDRIKVYEEESKRTLESEFLEDVVDEVAKKLTKTSSNSKHKLLNDILGETTKTKASSKHHTK